MSDLNYESLWNLAVKRAKEESNASYGLEGSKEKRVFQERIVSEYYRSYTQPR